MTIKNKTFDLVVLPYEDYNSNISLSINDEMNILDENMDVPLVDILLEMYGDTITHLVSDRVVEALEYDGTSKIPDYYIQVLKHFQESNNNKKYPNLFKLKITIEAEKLSDEESNKIWEEKRNKQIIENIIK